MTTLSRHAEILVGVICTVGWIAGVIAWAKRGFGIPRVVHMTAGISVAAEAILASIALQRASSTALN